MNPYGAPETQSTAEALGTFTVGGVIDTALRSLFRNAGPLVVVLVASFVAYVVSICTIVGWIAILPLIAWGLWRFLLDAIDGEAKLSAATHGQERFARTVGQMWAYFLVIAVPLSLLTTGPTYAYAYAVHGEAFFLKLLDDPITAVVVPSVASVVVGIVYCRLWLVPFDMVDRGNNVVAAVSRSWALTGPHWGRLIVVMLLVLAVMLPISGLTFLGRWLNTSADGPPWGQTASPVITFGTVGLSLFFSVLIQFVHAAIYRGLAGPRPEEA